MTKKSTLMSLLELRDELALQSHLLSMDLQTKWREIETRCNKLESECEQAILVQAQKLGESEQTFFVGNEQEIKTLISELTELNETIKGES